ncbi:aminoglycoside phosphotransferase family protein [Streptomyces cinnamoneus]|uniref:Hydroxyurea phosphotransferase n=1 Tax=Streptomyces cinnamoneus TaxID=53446 RepID=A0A918WCJ3_STRCJ|nr:aminoglycoside phosphotransferase family protein [Streptomyces cinnamoneus]GHC36273.1 hydroxyurea phosphotransferase [Streptomyces cinnamoneus]
MQSTSRITIPAGLVDNHATMPEGEGGPEWIAGLPELAAHFLDRWGLRVDGPGAHGAVALVLPVLREDSSPAALKLQPVTDESTGEPHALRVWGGAGAVGLLDEDAETGTMLLERLDAGRSLAGVPDAEAALLALSELLGRLQQAPPPAGMRRLADVASAMLAEVPDALPRLGDPGERRLLASCAAAVEDVVGEAGDRLLHWDLHYENVLAPLPAAGREPWLAIDPKPLVGDPAFDLLPAVGDRWDDVVATGDVARAVRRRFDLMTEVLGLDRPRAVCWTLGRVLQNCLWDIADGKPALQPEQTAIARALLS